MDRVLKVLFTFAWALVTGTAFTNPAIAAGKESGPNHANNIKVVSDKVEDFTTIEAILSWMAKSGMSDREKGIAVWETVVKLRQQNPPPNEYLEGEENVHDPVKTANVYGYGMCCCASSNIEALARAAGLQARGRIISHHSVPELFWNGGWHLLDASLITWFSNDKGDVASVDEIIASIKAWNDQNPALKDNDAELRKFMRGGGWKKGPAVLASSKYYDDNGWLPAKSHGWYSTMQEYDGKNNGFYEYGYSMGYRALFKLRRGEVLTRNWFNNKLHVNMDSGSDVPTAMTDKTGEGELRYTPKFGDIAPGRGGSGTLLYRVPLASKDWRSGAWKLDNVKNDKGIAPADKSKPADAVFRMHCPYVFLKGRIRIAGERKGNSGVVQAFISTNNGLDWAALKKIDAAKFNEEIDISAKVLRRYDYYVRLVLQGDVTIAGLEMENDIQCSQRALPALAQGENTITVSGSPSTDTITIAPSLKSDVGAKNEKLENFHPILDRVRHDGNTISGSGTVTFPVETPGDIYAVRFGGHFGSTGNKNGAVLQLSFDGKTWVDAGSVPGPHGGFCKYVDFNKVPPGVRKVLVRYQLNGSSIFSLRADVDYWDTPDGKPAKTENSAPLKVTYVWKEGGDKQQSFVAKKLPSTFKITCAGKPEMKSIIVEVAEGQ